MALKVIYNNGTTADADVVFTDFVSFERTWQRSVVQFENELRLTDLAWLAWHSETRTRKTNLKFDPDWTATVEAVEVRMEEPLPDEVALQLPKEG